ncbi:MAG: aromatic ring-hydroxylating dioxygenase subunit alpha, partial [Bacteroidetes bacterium]
MNIHPEIGKSSTLPASFYREPAIFEQVKEKVFASSWLYMADRTALDGLNNAHPFTLLPGVLN